MAQNRLRDFYFIEDPKHRRAFLKALKEVEEEGFEIEDAGLLATKIHKLEAETLQKRKAANTAKAITETSVGSTPADLSRMNRMSSPKSRKYTNTNAVDLKDYKYWRDEYYKKDEPNNGLDNDPIDEFDFPRPKFGRNDRKKPSLYEELFGETKSHEAPFERTKRSKLYDEIESMLNDDKVDDNSERGLVETRVESKPKKSGIDILRKNYLKDEKNQKHVEDTMKSYYENKLAQEKAEIQAKADSKIKDAKAEANKAIAEAKKAKAEADEAKKKLTVEVVAAEEKPKKTRKPSTKKKRKKLDSDIKLYRNIKID